MGPWDLGPDPRELGPPPDPRHLVLIWTQECWVRTHDPRELVPCPDPRELGPMSVPNRSWSGLMIQKCWVRTLDPRDLGPCPDPKDLTLVQTTENWVRTTDPRELVRSEDSSSISFYPAPGVCAWGCNPSCPPPKSAIHSAMSLDDQYSLLALFQSTVQ
uniref:Uncharacterized protein n=1 Tax=Populus trichocarpa TaxID=3694 RepID=A0A2K2AVK7_POPTR